MVTRPDGLSFNPNAQPRSAKATAWDKDGTNLELGTFEHTAADADMAELATQVIVPAGVTSFFLDDGQVQVTVDAATRKLTRIGDSEQHDSKALYDRKAHPWRYATKPSLDGLSSRRRDALNIAYGVSPAELGSDTYDLVTQGRHRAEGFSSHYSSCGDLAAYVLYELGDRDQKLVNRDDPELGWSWEVGKNISKLVNEGRAIGAWVTPDGTNSPKPGDIFLIGNWNAGEMEHVGIFVRDNGDGTVDTLNAGQTDIKESTRQVNGNRVGGRELMGWLDLDKLGLESSASSSGGGVLFGIGAILAAAIVIWKARSGSFRSNPSTIKPDLSTPRETASYLHDQLVAMFPGHYVSVVGQRGVGIEMARRSEEDYAREQFQSNFTNPPNLMVKIVIVPAFNSSAWINLSVQPQRNDAELKEAKVTPIRRVHGVSPEKAVDLVLKWFKKNSDALQT